MPSFERESNRIVIAGASSLLGAELKSLLEESRFAGWDLRLVDEEIAAGTLTEAGGEPAVIQPVEEGSFDRARLVFFTGSPEFTKVNLGAVQGATVIDPVSEAGRRGIEELESQTSQLLSMQSTGQSVFDTQVAFGMLNRYGAASRENLLSISRRICAEVSPLVAKWGGLASIQVVHAPIFYGYTFAALVETAALTTQPKLVQLCQNAGFYIWRNADGPLGNLSVGDSTMHLELPEESPLLAWWSWGAVDNIKLPVANAVKLAEKLAA